MLVGLQKKTYSRITWDRRIRLARAPSRESAQNLKLTRQATETVTYTDPDLCRTGLRMELARNPCGQIKTTSRCLSLFPAQLKH